jgi:hypothetical protein
MDIFDKSKIRLFKINNLCIVIKYDEQIPNNYELYFEGEVSYACPKLYFYDVNGYLIFGEYIEYRNAFIDLTKLNIEQQIFNFMLRKMTNIKNI